MNRPLGRLFLASLTVVLLSGFALTPAAGARGGGGGGGARAGGGAGAGAGAGARQSAQPNNSRADARTNDVRSTSVNNVNVNNSTNVNRNVNVNVDVDQRGGWDHPVAGAMVVGGAMAVTAAAIGSMVTAVPTGCVPINYGGMIYQQCGSIWYQPQGSQFVVVNPPY